jgi:hypothetical protein
MNENNIVRQIYLYLFRDKRKISDLLNFKEGGGTDNSKIKVSIKGSKYAQYKTHKPFSPIIYPPNYIDIERIRMFMFRYYVGEIDWDRVFFGNE